MSMVLKNSSSVPSHTAARHDGIAEHRDDDGAGARGFALELFDDAGKRMRHPQRIARFLDLRQRRPKTGAPRGHFSLAPPAGRAACGRRSYKRTPMRSIGYGEGDSPGIQLVESPPH